MTTFVQTILEETDLRTAENYSISPERNRVKKAKLSLEDCGLLDEYGVEVEWW